jgi:CRP/FNR family transcriptional regulator, dissimilatory nitrate respiration regulator
MGEAAADDPLAVLTAFKLARVEQLPAGAHLFRQGDGVTAIYQVEAGCLRLERTTSSGSTIALHTARAGEMLAEAALFSRNYHCDAVALKESRVRVFPKAAVLASLTPGSPAHALLAVLARQLMRARQRIELRNIRSAKERVMLFLDLGADRMGRIALDGPLQDLAAEIGLTREALYRTLASLERERRIARGAGAIRIMEGR